MVHQSELEDLEELGGPREDSTDSTETEEPAAGGWGAVSEAPETGDAEGLTPAPGFSEVPEAGDAEGLTPASDSEPVAGS